jgi:hypothetical protein
MTLGQIVEEACQSTAEQVVELVDRLFQGLHPTPAALSTGWRAKSNFLLVRGDANTEPL